MDFGIRGKRVLVTGGSSGLGKAIAKAFAKEGCLLSIVSRNEEKLKEVVREIGGEADGHDYIVADLRDHGKPTEVGKKLISKYNCIDIVVHNVGGALGVKDPLEDVNKWLEVWKFNVGVAIELNAVLIPPMQTTHWGRIVHISSISATLGEPRKEPYGGALPYAAAKSYLNTYVKGLAREFASENIIITALMPGAVLSKGRYWEKLQKEKPGMVDEFLKQFYPIGRLGQPEEIAPFAVFLASQQASFAAGSIVPVSGGRV